MQIDGTLLAPADPGQWPEFSKELRFVRISNVSNFSITGNGVIDGSGAAWWAKGSSDKQRPPLLGVTDSEHVSISSLTLIGGP